MPNRILRDGILTSERVNSLSCGAELLYRRLMSVVDDYGRYHGHPEIIRASCYPLQLSKVSQAAVVQNLRELEAAGLAVQYEAEGKRLVEISNFGQRQRSPSKFPAPPASPGRAVDPEPDDERPAKQARKTKTKMTEHWTPSGSVESWAKGRGFYAGGALERELEKFRNHFIAKGELRADWNASFRNWLIRAAEYSPQAGKIVLKQRTEWSPPE